MSEKFTQFDNIPNYGYFCARGKRWIKLPGTIRHKGVKFNTYSSALPSGSQHRDVAFFEDQTLVKYDAEEALADIALEHKIHQ